MPVQNRIFRHLPNFITSLNMLCGCIGAIYAFNNDLISASILILIAAIFDFLDGMAARLFNAYSDVGKELDSLADIISFGFTPSVILFQLLKRSLNIESFSFDLPIIELAGLILPFLIVVFSGLRLAKFNIDKSQTNSFIGLPTPASALFIIYC
ncbi:CDP-diacylglycerol--serine O-phosphatidyltransferase [Bacteroidota bacterium]